MLFSEYERFQYARSPLVEVICQLRFPTIQAIEAEAPEARSRCLPKSPPVRGASPR